MIRVAVIGLGAIAKSVHLPTLLTSDCTIAGVMDKTKTTAREIARQYSIPLVCESLDEVQADCALILTPKETHASIAISLLEKGIPVFLEKPMATSLRDAEAVLAAADRTRTLLMIGFNRRYAPAYEALKREWTDRPPDVILAEKNKPGAGYRGTMENAIHMVDLMRWICGEAVEVVLGVRPL